MRPHTSLCVDADGKTECVCGEYEATGWDWVPNKLTPASRQRRPDRDSVAVRDAKGQAEEIAADRFKLKKDRVYL